MPRTQLNPPLVPKSGRTLRALAIARISTINQDAKSIDDQTALVTRWLEDRCDYEISWTRNSGQGSGEQIDRQQVRDAEDAVESGDFDVVIMEDLGRHLRRSQAMGFCELCEDKSTRLFAINDSIDTADSNWRLNGFFAAIKHEIANRDTASRIRRTLRNRFEQGGIIQFVIFGYIKPPGAKSDSELQKDPAAAEVYDSWFRMLEEGAGYAEIADWLNANGVPTGRHSRTQAWNASTVAQVTHNPILKGVRYRNRKKSKRINRTGRRSSVAADPSELLLRECPHLAFIEPERYDRIIRLVDERNAKFKRGKGDTDPRRNKARKRTRWPGQHLRCGVCGRLLYYGGHGQMDHLMCSGARAYKCWQSATVDGAQAAVRLAAAVLSEIESLPDFEPTLIAEVEAALRSQDAVRDERRRAIESEISRIGREIDNVVQAIRSGLLSDALQDALRELERQQDDLHRQQDELSRRQPEPIRLPPIEDLKRMARTEFARLPHDSQEFGRLMHRLALEIKVLPFRCLDGGRIQLRAELTLSLTPLIADFQLIEWPIPFLRRKLLIDLTELPQRIRFRQEAAALQSAGATHKEISKRLNLTLPAVQDSLNLHRLMQNRQTTDPMVPVVAPPADLTKFKRHLHPRYHFEPLASPED